MLSDLPDAFHVKPDLRSVRKEVCVELYHLQLKMSWTEVLEWCENAWHLHHSAFNVRYFVSCLNFAHRLVSLSSISLQEVKLFSAGDILSTSLFHLIFMILWCKNEKEMFWQVWRFLSCRALIICHKFKGAAHSWLALLNPIRELTLRDWEVEWFRTR